MCARCEKLRRELETIQSELRNVGCNEPPRRAYFREHYQKNREKKLQQYRERRMNNV